MAGYSPFSVDRARIPVIQRQLGLNSQESLPLPLAHTDDLPTAPGRPSFKYPAPPSEGGVTEVRHGVKIKDPWRALEKLESETTQKFLREQNESHPARPRLEHAVREALAFERTSAPMLQGDSFFYWMYNPGHWARDVLVRSQDLDRFGKAPAPDEIVFDLNRDLDMSLYAYSWSPNGRYFTAILQHSGSDWQTIRTVDTVTKEPLEADLGDSKFTFGATYVGNQGFLYKKVITAQTSSGNDSTGTFSSADPYYGYYYHVLGSPQASDVLVWRGSGPDAKMQHVGRPIVCTSDLNCINPKARKWLSFDIYRNISPETEDFFFELPSDLENISGFELAATLANSVLNESKWLARGYTGKTTYIGTLARSATHLFFSTTDGAEYGRVLSLTAADFDSTPVGSALALTELVPEQKSSRLILEHAHLLNDHILVAVYLKDACAKVVFADAATGLPVGASDASGTRGLASTELGTEVPVPPEELAGPTHSEHSAVIPKHASITDVSCRSGSATLFLAVDTFVAPSYVLQAHVVKEERGAPNVRLSRLDNANAPEEDLVCNQVFYKSYDGVEIPLFICHARNLDFSKPQPLLLHAYGGGSVPITPQYNPLFATFMRSIKGVLAVACIRGGGEYGKHWHEVATGVNKFVSFEDFSHAARHLQAKGLTTSKMTASYGVSNGGMLVAACTNRDPELFGAVFCDVGVYDLTRFHLFTLGRLWQSEYGSPEDPKILPFLHAMSPLHNVSSRPEVEYPAMLVTTGDNDTRVIPGHSLKYLAELQDAKADNKNIFLGRIYENAGHESGSKSTAQKVEEAVDRLVFFLLAAQRN